MNSEILEYCEKNLPDRVLELICSFHHRKCKDCNKLLQNQDFNKHYNYTLAKKIQKKRSPFDFSVKHSFQCFNCFTSVKCVNKTEGKGYYCYSFKMNFKTEDELQNWKSHHS